MRPATAHHRAHVKEVPPAVIETRVPPSRAEGRREHRRTTSSWWDLAVSRDRARWCGCAGGARQGEWRSVARARGQPSRRCVTGARPQAPHPRPPQLKPRSRHAPARRPTGAPLPTAPEPKHQQTWTAGNESSTYLLAVVVANLSSGKSTMPTSVLARFDMWPVRDWRRRTRSLGWWRGRTAQGESGATRCGGGTGGGATAGGDDDTGGVGDGGRD